MKKVLAGSLSSKLGAVAPKKKKGGGFYSEKWAPPHRHGDESQELHKCTWPTRAELKGSTVVVVIAMALLSAFTVGVDFVVSYIIQAMTDEGKDIDFEYPVWICSDHYNGSKGIKRRSCTCSAGMVVGLDERGNPNFETGNKPCIPCYYIDEEGAGDYINRGRKVVFTGVVLKWFHQKTVDKKTVFEACAGKRCKLCSEGVKKQFGRRVFWPMGPVWAEYIMQKNAMLQKSCGCGGVLTYLGFSCPKCAAAIRDYDDSTPNDGEIEKLRTMDVRCPKCKEKVRAVAEVECDECDDPIVVDLWSVALKPLRIGDKYTPDLESWRPLKPKEIEALATYKPIDFKKFLSPSSLKDQAEWYGLKNPFGRDGAVVDSGDDEGADEWENEDSDEWT